MGFIARLSKKEEETERPSSENYEMGASTVREEHVCPGLRLEDSGSAVEHLPD